MISLNLIILLDIKTDAPSIKRNFDEIKIIDENYKYQNEIIFGNLKNKEFYTVNVVSFDEEAIDDEIVEIRVTNFSYVTSLKVVLKIKTI